MSQIYLGIMSGTSMDAIDVVAAHFNTSVDVLGHHSLPYPTNMRQELTELCRPGLNEINRCWQLDRQLGLLFAQAANELLAQLSLTPKMVIAIGSHGQTIRHEPTLQHPFTLQIGDPNVIAEATGITTIADFRRRDMACGGQGAPLTPAFHNFAFHSATRNRIVANIGGIANLTFLPADTSQVIFGFDTGPGNTLLDNWFAKHHAKPFDAGGVWAQSGEPNQVLLERLMKDPYFQLPFPKSTGREYFNLEWLDNMLGHMALSPQDIQSTLAELTAQSIMNAINDYGWHDCEILFCGGGVHNKDLMNRIQRLMAPSQRLFTTEHFGIHPNWVEAIAFAWLARQTINGLTGNLPAVTGADSSTILGGIYKAT